MIVSSEAVITNMHIQVTAKTVLLVLFLSALKLHKVQTRVKIFFKNFAARTSVCVLIIFFFMILQYSIANNAVNSISALCNEAIHCSLSHFYDVCFQHAVL